MASTVTIGSIITRAKRRADMESSGFISDAEWLAFANESTAALYDLLVAAFQNYFSTEGVITLVPGTASYDVPADFYKLISLDLLSGSSYVTMFPFNELERNTVTSTVASIPNATVRIRYVAAPPIYTDVTDTIDAVAGWDALLVTDMAIMALDKEESNTDRLEVRRQREYQRIQSMAQNRDITMPGRITDVTVFDNRYIVDSLQYRFYGNKLEFLVASYLGA